MEGLPESDPDPDMKIHYFATAVVHELIQSLASTEHDEFIDDLTSKPEADHGA